MKKLLGFALTVLAFAIAVEANTDSTADSNGDGEWRFALHLASMSTEK
ncbi:MAG: hypothetical protein HN880_08860 [Proteobacteria bacterium]|nr:hypothetical protein [Pseudomonadota bacterium]